VANKLWRLGERKSRVLGQFFFFLLILILQVSSSVFQNIYPFLHSTLTTKTNKVYNSLFLFIYISSLLTELPEDKRIIIPHSF
jgi:hypothetical protein